MIVFDSSTLILLAKTELLDIFLKDFGGDIAIPQAVHEECCAAKRTFDALLIQKRVDEKKISVWEIKSSKTKNKLMEDFNMGAGETEAIVLALEKKAGLLATDDKNAINACKLLNIQFTSAIQILVRAREKKLLTKEEAVLKLEALVKYGRYADKIIEEAKVMICKRH